MALLLPPRLQVIPLLVLIIVYWAYMRFFVPLASYADMAAEVSGAPQPGVQGNCALRLRPAL